MPVNLRGISKDRCFVNRLGALIPRRHLASLVQGDDRPGVQIVSQRRWDCAVKLRDAGSPLDNHRSGDQQHKKDRHQYRRYQPLTKIECGEFWHMTALLVEAGAQRSQSPITARGAR